MYYFYCPNCGKEDKVTQKPRDTVANTRDGWGVPIYHCECSNCHNLDAGCMVVREDSDLEKEYCHNVIKMYQNIRGFKR
jgi:predicted nucleic acid-binding Zn ribbon protein